MGGQQGKVCTTPEEAKQFIDEIIAAHTVVLFTKFYCPYCIKAISAFKKSGISYYEIKIYGRSDCALLQDELLKMTGERTVPRVFVHQKCIGGGNEAEALYKEGKLKALVEEGPKQKDDQQEEEKE